MRLAKSILFKASLGVSVASLGLLLPQSAQATVTCNPAACGAGLSEGIFSLTSFNANFTIGASDVLSLSDAGGTALVSYVFDPNRIIGPTAGAGATTPQFTYTLASSANPFETAFVGVNGSTGSKTIRLESPEFVAPEFTASTQNIPGFSAPPINFDPAISSADFTQKFSSTVDLVSITNTYTTKSDEVPGPLPILGAAAAFRVSRRMRNRIKAAA